MRIDKNGKKRYKVALHIHTTNSDGRVSPEESLACFYKAGFDAVAITDHWYYGDAGSYKGMTILSGEEFNFDHKGTDGISIVHIVGVGMKENPNLKKENTTPKQTVESIHNAGGIAILAHPCWSINTPEDALAIGGFDATEIYNSVSDCHESFRPYSGVFVDYLANLGTSYPLVAVDDCHYYDGDQCRSWIEVECETNSREDILEAIRAGRFYATQGPELLTSFDGTTLKVDCSPADKIVFVSPSPWERNRVFREKGTEHAEYTVRPYEKWIRVEVFSGNDVAWSNIIMVQK